MNIYAANLNNIIGNGTLLRVDSDKIQEKINKSKSQKNIYQQQIDEINANRDGCAERIMAKFYAGKKLSTEDLSYLAENASESYEKIKEAIRQREILEHQMEEANSTIDVTMAYTNTLTSAKNLADSEKGKQNPWIVMGTVGQFSDTYSKFVASIEYREKETEETKAKEIQYDVEQKKELLEQETEQIKDNIENQKEAQDEQSEEEQGLKQFGTIDDFSENKSIQRVLPERDKDIIKILEEEKENQKKRQKNRNKQSIDTFPIRLEQITVSIEKQIQFQKKIAGLYNSKENKIKSGSITSKSVKNNTNIVDIQV